MKRRENELKNSGEERKVEKKGKKKWSKGAADLTSGSLYVCLITKMPLETENI